MVDQTVHLWFATMRLEGELRRLRDGFMHGEYYLVCHPQVPVRYSCTYSFYVALDGAVFAGINRLLFRIKDGKAYRFGSEVHGPLTEACITAYYEREAQP